MYSYKERVKAIKLYIKYNYRESIAIRELGYPSRGELKRWYKEYNRLGEIPKKYKKQEIYSLDDKEHAIEHYLTHGKCITATIKGLGYPSRPTLRNWIKNMIPEYRKVYTSYAFTEFSQKEKTDAVIDLCLRNTSASNISEKYQTSKTSLYKWKKQLLTEKDSKINYMSNDESRTMDISNITDSVEKLEREIKRLKLEKDILEKTNELLKKGLGVDQHDLTNKEKAELIDTLKTKHPLSELLNMLKIPKSTYFYSSKARIADKYKNLRIKIKELFLKNDHRYGYRRIYIALLKTGIRVSEKVVRRLMLEEELVVFSKKDKKYSSYQGEISPEVDNIIKRDFSSDLPNTKWLTDITEFNIPAGKIYLSPIIDCFDGMVVSWSMGTSPNSELVTSMLDRAIEGLKKDEHPIIHSDRGSHYRWNDWISRMNRAGLVRSMSKKGCSPDNAACEGFFGRLKNEMFYRRNWLNISIDDFMNKLDVYINWYNTERIKNSFGLYSIVENRRNLGYL